MPLLFDPLKIRGVTLKNRVGISPMCQYSSIDGLATDWHLVHLGSRAVGGAGLVILEATAVTPEGRISPDDAGIWSDAHTVPLQRIVRFLAEWGAVPGIQLAHAGRKASTPRPWSGGTVKHWTPLAPSATPFDDKSPVPEAMTEAQILAVVEAFGDAARRSLASGFEWLELHGAHGYLIHSFFSPLSNHRTDKFGGSFENRTRFLKLIVQKVRGIWPDTKPLTVRLSCTDWREDGWNINDSVALAKLLKNEGVDLIDCSSGGILPHIAIPVGPGYQVPFAEQIRKEAGIMTAGVGMITDPFQAQEIIQSGKADLVLLARESIREPYWPIKAAKALGEEKRITIPPQYARGM